MKNIRLAITVLLAIIFFSAAAVYAAEDQRAYFPLKEGYTWSYEADMGNGQKIDLGVKVTGKQKVSDVDCYTVDWAANGAFSQREFFNMSDKGVTAYKNILYGGKFTALYEPPIPRLKFPLTPGKTWKWQGKIGPQATGDINTKVVGKETLSIPAGKFNTIKVEMDVKIGQVQVKTTRWFAPGVGLVKDVTQGPSTITTILKSYKTGGK